MHSPVPPNELIIRWAGAVAADGGRRGRGVQPSTRGVRGNLAALRQPPPPAWAAGGLWSATAGTLGAKPFASISQMGKLKPTEISVPKVTQPVGARDGIQPGLSAPKSVHLPIILERTAAGSGAGRRGREAGLLRAGPDAGQRTGVLGGEGKEQGQAGR